MASPVDDLGFLVDLGVGVGVTVAGLIAVVTATAKTNVGSGSPPSLVLAPVSVGAGAVLDLQAEGLAGAAVNAGESGILTQTLRW